MIVRSDTVEAAPTKTKVEIMEELCADLERRCSIMSKENGDIQNVIAQSPGV
jgi:hypothetical protein